MKNFTPELVAKAKTAKNAEELLEIARASGAELTVEEAKAYFEQLNAKGSVSDDELAGVVGGACGSISDTITAGSIVKVVNGNKCPTCSGVVGVVEKSTSNVLGSFDGKCVRCVACQTVILEHFNNDAVEKIVRSSINGAMKHN